MSMTIADVLAGLARLVDGDMRASWDPHGLQVGDATRAVETVGVCHEVTETVVDHVIGSPVDLLLTYHPLLFRETRRFVAGRSPSGRAFRLAAAGVGVATVHTAFDTAPGGTADALADVFGLTERSGFGLVEPSPTVKIVTFVPADSANAVAASMAHAGAGDIGRYSGCSFRAPGTGTFLAGEGSEPVAGSVGVPETVPEIRLEMVAPASSRDRVVAALVAAHPYETPAYDVYPTVSNAGFVGRIGTAPSSTALGDVAEITRDRLGGSGLRVTGDPDRLVERIAVVPGSGSSYVSEAVAVGADVLVTGDVDHHRAVSARDAGIDVVDPGHAATEGPGMESLVGVVRRLGSGVRDLTDLDPGPWR
jgi:dinuclear metal center YbgI/SA1388 family protein